MSANKSNPTPETSDTTESAVESPDYPYEDICGATNRNGNPCKLPTGWGTAGRGEAV
jgi:hypothetical protein